MIRLLASGFAILFLSAAILSVSKSPSVVKTSPCDDLISYANSLDAKQTGFDKNTLNTKVTTCFSDPAIQSQSEKVAVASALSNLSDSGVLPSMQVVTTNTCPADINNSNSVNIDDLLLVITNWGATSSLSDINGDGIVNIDDLLAVITAWGACPAVCGNGVIETPEICDDKNTTAGDGCSATCTIEPNAIQVCTKEQLNAVRNNVNATYIQTCDIDLTGYSMLPLSGTGGESTYFGGVYNGNSHTISNYNYQNTSQQSVGLFGVVYLNGKIVNAKISNAVVRGRSRVGTLVGFLKDTAQIIDSSSINGSSAGEDQVGGLLGHAEGSADVDGSSFTGTVMGSQNVGGFVGDLTSNSSVSNSSASASVSNFDSSTFPKTYIGGFVGQIHAPGAPSIANSSASGSVTAPNHTKVGGFAGNIFSSNVSNSNTSTNVIGGANTGGFSGQISGGSTNVSGSSSSGTVNGTDYVGGFVGRNDSSDSIISNSKSTGARVTATGSYVGGFVGLNGGAQNQSITNSFSKVGVVEGHSKVGGFFGGSDAKFDISKSFVQSTRISGTTEVGGFGGYVFASSGSIVGSITNSYTRITDTVEGAVSNSAVGGLIGALYFGHLTITNTYVVAPVFPVTEAGGFIGDLLSGSNIFTANFWNTSLAGVSTPCGSGICPSLGITGKTTTQMKQQSTYTNAGWDFVDIWDIASSYPFLR